MKPVLIVIIVIILIIPLCTLLVDNDFSDSIPDNNSSMIQSIYDSYQYRASDYTKDNKDFLLAVLGTDERGNERSRSDVIMVLKYNAAEHKLIVVSVPRDCKVPIPGKGVSKINAASAWGGARLQVATLEKLFKVENMRYVHFNFVGFVKIIDALGGVEINAKKDFFIDEDMDIKKGKGLLFGDKLLAYVRFRHDEEGDFGRIKRQQEVISSLAASILKPDKLIKLPEIALIIAKNAYSDMDIFYIMRHIKKLKNLDSLKMEFYTLETYSEKTRGIWYEIIDEESLVSVSDMLRE